MNQPATPNSLIEALERICEGGSEDHSPAKIAKMALADYRADRLVLPPVAAPVSQLRSDLTAIHRVQPRALEDSMKELEAWLDTACDEPLTTSEGESVGLVVLALKRIIKAEAASKSACVWCDAPSDTKSRVCCAPDGDGHLFQFSAERNAQSESASFAPTVAGSVDTPDWAECQRISDLPLVDEAFRVFAYDPTADNATGIVAAVANALAPSSPTAPGQQAQAVPEGVSDAARDVLAERKRQITAEGWTPKHDDDHDGNEMAKAAACYAYPELTAVAGLCAWPWHEGWWKPKDERRNLVKAGALVLAEIERLDRASQRAAARASANTPEGK